MLENHEGSGLPQQQLLAKALSDFFVKSLSHQDDYEQKYAKLVKDPGFSEIWREQVANLDMDWVSYLTKLQSISKGYIKNNSEMKKSLQEVLMPLAEKYQPKPGEPSGYKVAPNSVLKEAPT